MSQLYLWVEPDVPFSPSCLSVVEDAGGLVVAARATVNAKGETAPEGVCRLPAPEARKLWRALGEWIALRAAEGGGS